MANHKQYSKLLIKTFYLPEGAAEPRWRRVLGRKTDVGIRVLVLAIFYKTNAGDWQAYLPAALVKPRSQRVLEMQRWGAGRLL